VNPLKPKFITFEGPEGSGKTSVIKAIVDVLTSKNIPVLTTREPGGIKISEQIRRVILDVDNTEMDARTEALLYASARRQHIAEKILPALKEGKHILCDRYVDSSLAYQGYGRGLGIDEVFALNQFAIDGLLPDLTIFIDVPPSIGLKRVFSNGRKVDRLDLETISFHEKVYEGYKTVIKKFPERIKVVDGTKPIDNVINEALALILDIL
jgi:dTMP kinase